jgi:hypothetical protein
MNDLALDTAVYPCASYLIGSSDNKLRLLVPLRTMLDTISACYGVNGLARNFTPN